MKRVLNSLANVRVWAVLNVAVGVLNLAFGNWSGIVSISLGFALWGWDLEMKAHRETRQLLTRVMARDRSWLS